MSERSGLNVMEEQKRKGGRPLGEVTNFIASQADFGARHARDEINRLIELAKTMGITTTESSVGVTYYRLKKQWESQNKKSGSPVIRVERPEEDQATDQKEAGLKDSEAAEAAPIKPMSAQPSLIAEKKPVITPPAKPYVQTTKLLPAKSIVAEGDEWFDPNQSVFVNFHEGRGINSQSREGLPYIGRIAGRDDKKVVLPLAESVQNKIAAELKRLGKFPIMLPCFLKKKETYWLAHCVDLSKLEPADDEQTKRMDDLSARMQYLESQVMRLCRIVDEVDERTRIQRMLIVFDFQNFSASYKERGTPVHPRFVVEQAARFETLIPRRVAGVVIVDFSSSRGKTYCDNIPNYEFVAVPDVDDVKKNPTDQVIYQTTLEKIQKLNLEKGSLVAIVSGDAHFLPLIHELKMAGFQTMTVGRESHMAKAMQDADYCLVLP